MEIRGHFEKVIYYRQDNGYIVALFAIAESRIDEEVVIRGYMDSIDMDKQYILSGEYVEHPKYGIQFEIQNYQKLIATNRDDLIRYLSSSQF